MSIETNATDGQRILELVAAGFTPDEAFAKVTAKQIAKGAPKPKVNQQPKAKTDLLTWLQARAEVIQEYQFHPTRKWRADYYLPEHRIIVEYDGLMRHGENHGHASINGILRDSEKINAATAMGIRVFRANAKSLGDESFYKMLAEVLAQGEQS